MCEKIVRVVMQVRKGPRRLVSTRAVDFSGSIDPKPG